MTITLRPEQEQLVAEVLRSGSYHNADEVIERALALLHEHEKWLADTRATIEEGYAAAQRGELIDGDEVRARLEKHKRDWLAQDKM
jgi:antitoxin ParD1/3/4